MEVNKAGDAAMHEWVLLPVASSSRGVPEMALENLSPQAFASNTSTMICQKKGLLQHSICSRSTPTPCSCMHKQRCHDDGRCCRRAVQMLMQIQKEQAH